MQCRKGSSVSCGESSIVLWQALFGSVSLDNYRQRLIDMGHGESVMV
jgi:hypothetical protein